jgi:hypothetical protein
VTSTLKTRQDRVLIIGLGWLFASGRSQLHLPTVTGSLGFKSAYGTCLLLSSLGPSSSSEAGFEGSEHAERDRYPAHCHSLVLAIEHGTGRRGPEVVGSHVTQVVQRPLSPPAPTAGVRRHEHRGRRFAWTVRQKSQKFGNDHRERRIM